MRAVSSRQSRASRQSIPVRPCTHKALSRHVLLNITYLHALVHNIKLFSQENQAENLWQCYYACIHIFFLHAKPSDRYAVWPWTSQYLVKLSRMQKAWTDTRQ